MKYLVNRETKEHVLCATGPYPDSGVWRIVEADEEGWIKWHGGKCPLPLEQKVQYECRQDDHVSRAKAKDVRWEWIDAGGDIIAYRPILTAESKPTLEETWHAIKKKSKVDVFARLSAAVAASESIPALIAEINAMLPEGYEVREKAKTEAVTAKELSEWKEGDLLECIISSRWWWARGKIYPVLDDGSGLYVRDEDGDKRRLDNIRHFFKFHSRPVTK